jgi:hypothetical protein
MDCEGWSDNHEELKATENTMSDNKVRELATMRLPWKQWTETSVWFDNVGISVFHSCVVVDLWQSLSEWRQLMSECVIRSVPSLECRSLN